MAGITYIFTDRGIIAVQAGPEAIQALKEAAGELYKKVAEAYSEYNDVSDIAE